MADENKIMEQAAYAVFAAVAGLLGYVMRQIDQGLSVSAYVSLAKGLSSGFVGVLVYWACQAIGIDGPWVGVIIGTTGWVGADATIMVLSGIVYRKLGISEPRNKP